MMEVYIQQNEDKSIETCPPMDQTERVYRDKNVNSVE